MPQKLLSTSLLYLEFIMMSKELSKKDCLIARSLGVLTSHMHSAKLPKFVFYCNFFFFLTIIFKL